MSVVGDFAKDFFKADVFIAAMMDTLAKTDIREDLEDASLQKLGRGVDAHENKLNTDKSKAGAYSPYNPKNKRQNYVDLDDEGDFYQSFNTAVKDTYVELYANFDKGSSNIYNNFQNSYSNFNEFENAVLKLNDYDFKIFIDEYFAPTFLNVLKNKAATIIKTLR